MRRLTRTMGDDMRIASTWSYVTDSNLVAGINSAYGSLSSNYTYDVNKNKMSESLGAAGMGFGDTGHDTVYDAEDRLTTWNRNDGANDQQWALSAAGVLDQRDITTDTMDKHTSRNGDGSRE